MSSNQPDSGRKGSVTRHIPGLQRGENQAVQVLWERYFEPMVRVAEARLRGAPSRAGANVAGRRTCRSERQSDNESSGTIVAIAGSATGRSAQSPVLNAHGASR